jgi:hypothetical protein
MTEYQTHSWPSVVAFYRDGAREHARLVPMAALVARIAESRYASGLHPVTSHYLLRLFAREHFDFSDDQIRVDHDGEAFEVRYTSSARVRPHSLTPITSDWSKRSPDGFDALERCLHHLRWLTEERDSSSRPAS